MNFLVGAFEASNRLVGAFRWSTVGASLVGAPDDLCNRRDLLVAVLVYFHLPTMSK